MSLPYLPYGRQQIDEEDGQAVVEALRQPLVTQGPSVDRFERAFADYVGAQHAVAYSSGTAALHGAAFAARLGPGDEALTPALSFAASANCVLYQGAQPVLVDIDPGTLNLDLAETITRAGERTRAVIAVSFAGLPADLDALAGLRPRLTVVEDASHALGALRAGRPIGGPGGADLTTFSFHPVKSITSAEGGMVTTEDGELARRLRLFRTHGITKEDIRPSELEGDWYYEMQALGFNYRLSDLHCALGLSQLGRLDGWIARRNEIAALYRDLLARDDRVLLPPEAPAGSLHAYHLFIVQVRAGAEARLRAFEALRAAGVGVQIHYIPIYRLPYYRDTLGFPQTSWPNVERYYWGAMSLPMFPAMTPDDVRRVVAELKSAVPAADSVPA
jgi:UDP-4-amino-4,6-dideoxy-N-acetyl-beta-L-altrosamine transaminase